MSFEPIYKLRRSKPTAADKLLLIDRLGQAWLKVEENGNFALPQAIDFPDFMDLELPELGSFRGNSCLGYRHDLESPEKFNLTAVDLRDAALQLDKPLKKLILRGKPVLEWLATRKYCSVCGNLLEDHEQEEARFCPNCRMLFFPKISPAVIVLVKRDDGRILLAHNQRFKHKVYSMIAGFVEPGETAEDAVRREVREEVGLEIKNIQYKYSQSWPFPDSLMLGFTAEYASGQLSPDGEEIVDANFYSIDDLPPLPGKSSIARRIIDEYITDMKNK